MLVVALAVALALSVCAAPTGWVGQAWAGAPGPQTTSPIVGFADAAGIHVVAVTKLDPRQYNISVLSAALGRPVDVRVLLPDNYDPGAGIRYPVLYLFHGTSGRASDWVNQGNAEAATAGLPLIVVMPDAGFNGDGGGWFTNWNDPNTVLGPSQWETFHVGQLIPWIDRNLATVATRSGRAVAGLSQGGFGSMTYAARHPDTFVSAAAFSGAPDIDYNPVVAAGATVIIDGTALGLDGVEPDAMFGSRLTNEINWQGHDPADLAPNLRATSLWLYTATGIPGPLDPPTPNPSASAIEALTHASTMSFYQHLNQLGIPSHLDNYVFGTHTWAYWSRDLRQYLVPLMAMFAHPPATPATISYESIDPHWTEWGWSVNIVRPAVQQFSQLQNAGVGGFSLSGQGLAEVITPPLYGPLSAATVSLSGATTEIEHISADSGGRLHIPVPVGGSFLGIAFPATESVAITGS